MARFLLSGITMARRPQQKRIRFAIEHLEGRMAPFRQTDPVGSPRVQAAKIHSHGVVDWTAPILTITPQGNAPAHTVSPLPVQ
jgi:hypothetical protein